MYDVKEGTSKHEEFDQGRQTYRCWCKLTKCRNIKNTSQL